jgi:hypothetical protein
MPSWVFFPSRVFTLPAIGTVSGTLLSCLEALAVRRRTRIPCCRVSLDREIGLLLRAADPSGVSPPRSFHISSRRWRLGIIDSPRDPGDIAASR